MPHNPHNHTVAKWFFVLIATLVIFTFWKIIEPFALALVTAIVAAIIFTPLDRWLLRRVRHPKLSAIIVVVAVFALVLIPLFATGALMVAQASEIVNHSIGESGWVSNFNPSEIKLFQMLPEAVQEEMLSVDFTKLGTGAAAWVVEHIGDLFSGTVKLLVSTFIFFVAFYYLLVDRERIYQLALDISPFRDKLDAKILHRIVSTVRGVVFGALIVAIVQGVFAAVGMSIFGVPGAIVWGALVIVAAQVPMIGAALILGPAVAYLFFTGSPNAAIGLLIWSVIVVGMIDNVLSPYLVSGRTKMHGLLILLAILGGLQLFGPIGFVIGPTIVAALMVVIDLYRSGILEKGIGRV